MPNDIVWDDAPNDKSIVWDPAPAKKPVTSLQERIQTGVMDPIVGAAQLADKLLVNPIRQLVSPGASSMEDVIKDRDANYQAPEGLDWGRIGGNVLNPISWAGGGPVKNAVGTLLKRGAQVGAVQAGLAPTESGLSTGDYFKEKLKQAGYGAAGGGVVTLGSKLPNIIGGLPATDSARALMAQGVQPTVGQGLGGVANKIEQQLTSAPILGDAIQHARNRAQDEFQTVALQRAMTGSSAIPDAGFKVASTVDEANKVASHLYDSVVPSLVPHLDAISGAYVGLKTALANPRLTSEGNKQLRDLTKSYFANFPKMKGSQIKELDSQIGYDIRRYAAGDPNHQAIADGLQEIQQGFRSGLESGLPAELRGTLKEANSIFRRLIPFNKAASSRADEKVLPRALQKASARQARVDSSRYIDDLIDPALDVLPNTVPDSGTAGRWLLNTMALGGSVPLGVTAPALGAGAVGWAGQMRPVQKVLLGGYPIQGMVRDIAPRVPVSSQANAALISALRGDRSKGE